MPNPVQDRKLEELLEIITVAKLLILMSVGIPTMFEPLALGRQGNPK